MIPLKILYVNSLNIGVYYWRIENYANTMVSRKDVAVNVRCFYHPKSNIAWDRVCLEDNEDAQVIRETLESAFQFFDAIIFQKIQHIEGLQLVEGLKIKYPKTVILMECDDSIGELTPSNVFNDKVEMEHNVAARHALLSDGIITSTEYLKNSIKIIAGPNKPMHVAPNCIDYSSWKIEETERPGHSKSRVVYVGAAGHDDDLYIAYKAVEPMLNNLDFIVRYGGFRPEWLTDERVDFKIVDWSIADYPQKLYDLNADVALAPLEDTEFNRCKSNLKWVEWSSVGVPLIASKVEPFIRTKGIIYLANNEPESFRHAIKGVLTSPNYTALCSQLKKQNKQYCSIEKEVGNLLTFIKDLCNIVKGA